MDGLLLAARLVLAAVFIVAGLSKLADLAGARKAARDFGVPEPLAAPVGFLLPLGELAIGVLLLLTRTAWITSIVAGALLAVFIVAIVFNLARGRKPDCACFGQVASGPIGWGTVVRNVVLGGVAVFIAVGAKAHGNSGTSAFEWLTRLRPSEIVGLALAVALAALLVAQWGFLLNLLRQNGRLLERLETMERGINALSSVGQSGSIESPVAQAPAQPVFGLPVGSEAPSFALSGLFGEVQTLDSLRAQGKPLLLLFTDPTCGPCGELLPDIGRWQREYESQLTLALISRGTVDANRMKTSEHGVRNVLLQTGDEVAQAYQAPGTPSAVMVQPDGTIGTPVSPGADTIRTLVAGLMGPGAAPAVLPSSAAAGPVIPLLDQIPDSRPPANGGNGSAPTSGSGATVTAGQPAPALKLKDLDNRSWDLSTLNEEAVLVFWNNGCGYCKQMLPDLKEWERNKPAGAPHLFLVSSGSVEDNRALGLRSTVLLDQNFETGGVFGASGTPMAIKLDASGRVASELGAGAPGVWPLLGGGPAGAGSLAPSAVAGGSSVPLKVGDAAPALKLPDLNGRTVNLSDFRGSNTLLLFWNNGCGFCQQMLPDLKAWEANKPKGAPKLLVISRGTAEENKALGLRSTIVLDDNFSAGAAFGAGGTPMGVLIDPNGNVASEVAAGAQAVFSLATPTTAGARPVS